MSASAQTADRIKYYILYDKSGSVSKIDKNQNLEKLMSGLIELSKADASKKNIATINSASSFTLYPFGTEKSLTQKETAVYDPFISTATNSKTLIDKIVDITNYSKNSKEKFSNIHTALELLNRSVDVSQASGIFIFTDGVLSQNDYDIDVDTLKKVDKYYKYLGELLTSIRLKTNKPVFLVQTSYKPLNPYYPGINKLYARQKLAKDSVTVINDSTVFWIKDTEMYNPNDVNKASTKAFADFVARANDMIIRSEPQFGVSTNSLVDKSVLINNIGEGKALLKNVVSRTNKIDLSTVLNILAVPALSEEQKKVLTVQTDSLMRTVQHNVPVADLKLIRDYIEKVDIEQLRDTLNSVQRQIASRGNLLPSLNSFVNISASSVAFSPATATSTALVSQTRGIKSLEQDAILAVTDYIIERAKQEAVFTFLENVNGNIIQKGEPLMLLFPELTATLKNPDNYHDMNLLKQTLKRDISMLPDNIDQSGIFKENEALTGIVAMIRLFKNINENQSIESAFQQLSEDLVALNLPKSPIVHAMKFTSNVIGYLTTNDLASVYNDKPKLERLSKLIVALSIDTNIMGKINSLDLNNSAVIVQDIYTQYRLISKQIAEFNKDIKPNADFDGYRKLRQDAVIDIMSRSSDLLFSGYNILNSLQYKIQPVDFKDRYQRVLKEFKRVKDGYFLIKSKEYTQAALLLAPVIFETIYTDTVFRKYTKLKNTDSIKKAVTLYVKQKEVAAKVLYIAAEVSEAESAERIKKIIAKYALPVASYRIKHTSSPNFMIGSYLGFGGAYFVETDKAKASFSPILSAPIGLDWSFKCSPESKSSFSLFASIIDVGNIVSYRLWNKNNADEKDVVKLENIVSPGLYGTWSPSKKLPLSVNLGYGFNPGRVSLSLNFDMPLFAIYRAK